MNNYKSFVFVYLLLLMLLFVVVLFFFESCPQQHGLQLIEFAQQGRKYGQCYEIV